MRIVGPIGLQFDAAPYAIVKIGRNSETGELYIEDGLPMDRTTPKQRATAKKVYLKMEKAIKESG